MKPKIIYIDSDGNEWLVKKKKIPNQEWNFYWIAECHDLKVFFKGKVKKYVLNKIKEYEAN